MVIIRKQSKTSSFYAHSSRSAGGVTSGCALFKGLLLALITGQSLYLFYKVAELVISSSSATTTRLSIQEENGRYKDIPRTAQDATKKETSPKQPFRTGAITDGYVLDLIQERQTPNRRLPAVDDALHEIKSEQQAAESMTYCEYYDASTDSDSILQQRAACRNPSPSLKYMAYNPAPFPRYLHCGGDELVTLAPGATMPCSIAGTERCTHVFPTDRLTQPMVIYDAQSGVDPYKKIAATKRIPCDVPCEYDTALSADIMHHGGENALDTLGVQNTGWRILQSIADPYYNGAVKIERTNYRHDVYYSTTSFRSSVPLSFYQADIYHLDAPPKAIDWTTTKNRATYILNDHCRLGNRGKWLKAVEVQIPVDTYGSCNADQPGTAATLEGRLQLMRENRIVLALEAGTDKDHITAIVWEALLSGAVPAILGANNLDTQHLPRHAAIFATQFNSWDKFAKAIAEVANNQTLWESYQQWRADPAEWAAFAERYAFLQTSPECRLCRWAQAQQFGLRGWNHTLQKRVGTEEATTKLCFSTVSNAPQAYSVLTQPFREVWEVSESGYHPVYRDETCTTTPTSKPETITVHGYAVERSIVTQDGVIDITFHSIRRLDGASSDLVLRLEMDGLRNTDGAYFPDTHVWLTEAQRTPLVRSASLQDERTKVTVVANWPIPALHSPAAGVMEVTVAREGSVVPEDDIRRLRIIMEDMSPLHDKMTEFFPSAFGRRMMHDFIDPVQFYYASIESAALA
jgi:Glycosyltransferase family 10 (fucosyltransferase) C-term